MLLLLSYLTWGRRLYRASQKCWATRPSARDSELTATSPKARRDLPRGSWKPVVGGTPESWHLTDPDKTTGRGPGWGWGWGWGPPASRVLGSSVGMMWARPSASRSPDVEVLHVDILVRGRLSLAPEEEPLLGRGLCRTHEDSKPKLTAKGTAPRAGGSPLGLRHKGQREAGGRGPWTGQPQCGCPFQILAARQAPEAVTPLGSPWK